MDMLKAMYVSVEASAYNSHEFTYLFQCPLGVKQGCKQNSLLVLLFICFVFLCFVLFFFS